jgi:hypothetical protein
VDQLRNFHNGDAAKNQAGLPLNVAAFITATLHRFHHRAINFEECLMATSAEHLAYGERFNLNNRKSAPPDNRT